MANQVPLIVDSAGQVQRLQAGDDLVSAGGDGYVTAASAFGTDNRLLRADGTGRGAQASSAGLSDTNRLTMAFTTGSRNLAIGSSVLLVLASGNNNVGVGDDSLASLTAGSNNFGMGAQALNALDTGSSNTSVGSLSLLVLSSGSDNTALGGSALGALAGGSGNMALGNSALVSQTSGSFNNGIGRLSLSAVTTGQRNTGVGESAGRTLVDGVNNTFLGRNSGFNASQKTDAVNSMALGNGAYTDSNNQAVLGDANVSQAILRGTVDVVRGTNACRVNVYNTSSSANFVGTNYERVVMRWDSNVAKIGTQAGGSGTARDLELEVGSTTKLTLTASDVVAADGVGFYGESPPGSQPAHITDAEETHAFGTGYDATELQNAADALGVKINAILALLESYGIVADS